jgi:hypothetical protein
MTGAARTYLHIAFPIPSIGHLSISEEAETNFQR